MKYSWNWLCDYVDLAGIEPMTVAERFTMTVAELEGVEHVGQGLEGVIVGRIVSVADHPDSAKLKLIDVDVGQAGGLISGVSGAPNVQKDILVPLALPGTMLPGGVEVNEVEIRGVKSALVALSEKEMGISDDHSGVMELPSDAVPGARLIDTLPVVDTVFEVDNKSITHRPDLWGHHGVAREIAAMTARDLKPLDVSFPTGDADVMQVQVDEPADCPRYMGMCFDGVSIAPSPFWIQHRLRTVGHRPINNVVDLTNYVMLSVGEPMHAFDRRTIRGDKIVIRRAADGEPFKTLDGQDHVLSSEDLLIADGERGVALAGVMGGENSEVMDDTSSLFIECANFNAGRVRRTSVRCSLRTDASTRFEKSLDPVAAQQAMSMFVTLLGQLCPGGAPSSKVYDVASYSTTPVRMKLDPSFISRRLGTTVTSDVTLGILTSLGFNVDIRPDGTFRVTVPSWRATKDVSISEDLLEEIGRFVGYDNIVPAESKAIVSLVPRVERREFIYRSKHTLARDCGLDEIERYSFDSIQTLQKIGYKPADPVRLKNPISADQVTLRTDLAPGMLDAMALNSKNFDDFRMFEIGRVFKATHNDEGIPIQEYRIGILAFSRQARKERQLESLFLDAKGIVQRFIQSHGFNDLDLSGQLTDVAGQIAFPWVNPVAGMQIKLGGNLVGYATCVHPAVMRGMDVLGGAVYVDFDLELLMNISRKTTKFKPIPRSPSSRIDLSLVVPDKTRTVVLETAIVKGGGESLTDVQLVDVYVGKPIPDGRKSMTFSMVFQAADRTLSDFEIKQAVDSIVAEARQAGASLWGETGE